MDLKLIIERAEKVAGSQKALAVKIGQSEGNIRAAKSGARGLPNYACLIIAEMIEEDETVVLAASELNTEKKPERRAFWEKKLERLAAMVLLGVVSVVTPTPSEAAPLLQVPDSTLYIMSNIYCAFINTFNLLLPHNFDWMECAYFQQISLPIVWSVLH